MPPTYPDLDRAADDRRRWRAARELCPDGDGPQFTPVLAVLRTVYQVFIPATGERPIAARPL